MTDSILPKDRVWIKAGAVHLTDDGFDPDGPLTRDLVHAVSYVLRLNFGESKAGCSLVPATNSPTGPCWPPRISDVADETVALWQEMAARVSHDAAKARFHDLLFERGDGKNKRDHALVAASGYLAHAEAQPGLNLDVSGELVRAWDVARRVGSTDLEQRSTTSILACATSGLDASPASPPGCVLPLLAVLVAPPVTRQSKKNPQQEQPAAIGDRGVVDALLERAWTYTPTASTRHRSRS